MGYDTTNVIVYYEAYYLESKYRFTKEFLNQKRELGITSPRMNSTGNRTLGLEYQHIMITLNTGSYYDYNFYIEDAVDAWNNQLDCNLDFQISSRTYDEEYDYSIGLELAYDSPELPFLALTEDRWNTDRPHEGIRININHEYWNIVTGYGQITYLAMHAIGELIGLSSISNTNNMYIDRSIMLDENLLGQVNTLWGGFSTNDISTLKSMYPIPTTEFAFEWSGSDSTSELLCQTNSTISVAVTQSGGNQIDYTVEYTVDADESDYTVSEWGSTLNFEFLEAGTYTVTITPVTEEKAFAGETVEIVVYDIPEMGYSWSPELPNTENKFQINEPYHLSIEGLASEFDLTVTIAAETSGNQYTCTKVNDREYQITFEDLGTYDIALIVKRGTRTLITETIEVTAVDEPTFDFSWSPIPENTKNNLLKAETYTLAISGLSSQYTVDLEVIPDTVEMEYDLMATSNRNFELTFNDTGKYNLAINIFNGERLTISKTIEVTVIEQPSINPTWTATCEIGEYYALSTDYTLNLNYVNDYYDNSNGFTYTYAAYLNDVDKTSTVLKSKNGQQAVFNFNLPGEYRIVATVKYSSTVLETYETTCPVVGGKIVRGNSPEVPTLNSPYTFTYHYWHPEHEEVSYEFKMSEELFDAGSSRNIYYQMESANSFMISFLNYGCYYIEATVKDGYEVCDKKIINFTKLYHPETCTFDAYESYPNPNGGEIKTFIKYHLAIGAESLLPERFYGIVQKYKEVRTAFYITDISNERRVDREFSYFSVMIQREKGDNALCNLPDGSFGMGLNPDEPCEIYEGYTGYIHYPMDGVRLVSTKDPEVLPVEQIKYEVSNNF